MAANRDLTAREAALQLGISLSTLYAYVSRGLIHSRPGPTGSREKRYASADVLALRERQALRRDPSRSAETALSWGTPVLESAITLIENGKLFYRGYDAVELAQTMHFEEVVGLLWFGRLGEQIELASASDLTPLPAGLPDSLDTLERVQIHLPLLASADPAAYDLRAPALRRAGARVLTSMAMQVAEAQISASIATAVADRWAPGVPNAERLIDAALIISADHELNPSSFTVRCVAATGAPLYDAIGAGIAALRGTRHGASSYRIEALLAEIETPERAASVLEDRLRRGEPIPGFGHNLYPNGDPRAVLLNSLCHELTPSHPALALTDALFDAAAEVIQERPNVDLGLVTVARVLGMPNGSALKLMALGRVAGWVAHALEQYPTQRIIRPRAKYVGPAPNHLL